jgi:tRNA A-37 threonylcarbamoyl transferase component Bud32/membrane associated rhomboid family serine protease
MNQHTQTPEAEPNRCPDCDTEIPSDAPDGFCPRCLLAGAADPTDAGQPAAGAPAVPSLEKLAPAFPHLEILELIGRGGMGAVFKARQPKLERFVALKVLSTGLAAKSGFRERFSREARVLARLSHPAIVSVYDVGEARGASAESEGFFYLLMEYVDGVNLRQAMRAGRFTPEQALSVVPGICEALAYAHSKGVLHRDIKPENILLDARGQVKIADFGIAKITGDAPVASEALTDAGGSLGTPHYMAPEQIEKPSEVDHRADIYSLGVVFYEMLTGELPLGRFAPPSERAVLDHRVDEIVMRALAKDRELRQQSVGEMKSQVETLTSDSGKVPNVSTPPGVPWSRKAIFGAVFTVAGCVVLAVADLQSVDQALFYRSWRELAPWFGLGAQVLLLAVLPGWLGLQDIRRSGGRRRGLLAGVFSALFLPLLLSSLLAIMFLGYALSGPVTRIVGRDATVIVYGLLVLLALALNGWLLSRTARWGAAAGGNSHEGSGLFAAKCRVDCSRYSYDHLCNNGLHHCSRHAWVSVHPGTEG